MNDALTRFHSALGAFYPDDELRAMFFHVMKSAFGIDKAGILARSSRSLTECEIAQFDSIITQLAEFRPLQYALGKTEFFGMEFAVDESTLIPRPETEELVEIILSRTANKKSSLTVLDIGTGSGCIAVALARHLPCKNVFATDISADAIDVASRNATANQVVVNFVRHDIFCDLPPTFPPSFDLIVSNPPYIMHSERANIHRNVLDNEPHLALFAHPDNPIAFYRRIAELGSQRLRQGGLLFFELNPLTADETLAAVRSCKFRTADVEKDISGKNRFLIAEKFCI
jgi:release factor glutamine methyltransferase